jgi:hypothetical protein
MTDFAIVHITDLHYPVHGDPVWKEPFMTAIKRLPDDTVAVKGIAVTGSILELSGS